MTLKPASAQLLLFVSNTGFNKVPGFTHMHIIAGTGLRVAYVVMFATPEEEVV